MENYIKQVTYTEGNRLQGSEALRPILELLENAGLPSLDHISRTDMKDIKVKSYTDAAALKFLDKRKYALEFLNNSGKATALIMQMPNEDTSIGVYYYELERISPDELYLFFKKTISATNPFYGRIELSPNTDVLYNNYENNRRTFYSPGLTWLQYYAGAELERQGGIEAIEKNPHAKTERFHEGIIVQVGESPFDSQTIPGRALLVNATKAMPPSHWR